MSICDLDIDIKVILVICYLHPIGNHCAKYEHHPLKAEIVPVVSH